MGDIRFEGIPLKQLQPLIDKQFVMIDAIVDLLLEKHNKDELTTLQDMSEAIMNADIIDNADDLRWLAWLMDSGYLDDAFDAAKGELEEKGFETITVYLKNTKAKQKVKAWKITSKQSSEEQ